MLGCLYEIQWTMGLDNPRILFNKYNEQWDWVMLEYFLINTMNNGIGKC